ncbi:MAG: GNAT family N-acetyltransferase [Segniliparus sp.]|uniref:GNAT family N-acetyltransferase n=1 Tax=Segniliparus sp. TaxID=2804064 RepID=UPI003F394AAF
MQGPIARLVPLAEAHVPQLVEAAAAGRDTFRFTGVPAGETAMRAFVARALAEQKAGDSLPFAIVDRREDRVVGTTRFFEIERWEATDVRPSAAVAEIGHTWLAASVQGTGVNTGAKLLMLDHGFGVLGLIRVSFRTDARNARSRRAIEKLGARFEGIRRAHMPAFDGGVRDSAFYSILREEWPLVRPALAGRVSPE